MSTYFDVNHPRNNGVYEDCPEILREYLYYIETIQNRSMRTANGYYIDLRMFLRFIKQYRKLVDADINLDNISIMDVDLDFVRSITKAEIYEFLHYITRERSNSPASRARKASSIKGYFRYLTTKAGYFKDNPAQDIEMPSNKKRLPKYLSLEESIELLKNVESDFPQRDYCILTLFLNCGMRLSELVGIDLLDYRDHNIRIVGKGNKERLVYLNKACILALEQYLAARAALKNIKPEDKNAMFLSARTGRRLTPRRVQQIVEQNIKISGLSGKGYSTHKLRHTAATLMYRFGNVDMLALKEILGHVHVSTTEIYTHIATEQLQKAVEASPLAKVDFSKEAAEAVLSHQKNKEKPD